MLWKLGNMLTKPWYGMYVPAFNTLMDLDQSGSPDFYAADKTVADKDKVKGVVYVAPEEGTYRGLTNRTNGYMKVLNERVWDDKMYLKPIPGTATVVSPGLQQNPGW